eukprot:427502-Pyramimonas_sp.AAC.2
MGDVDESADSFQKNCQKPVEPLVQSQRVACCLNPCRFNSDDVTFKTLHRLLHIDTPLSVSAQA